MSYSLGRTGKEGELGDFVRAAALDERACHGGEQAACASLGALLLKGRSGLAADPRRGEALLKAACEQAGEGCAMLAIAYEFGRAGRPQDLPRAQLFFRRGCDAWDGESCDKVGEHERACTLRWRPACVAFGVGSVRGRPRAMGSFGNVAHVNQRHMRNVLEGPLTPTSLRQPIKASGAEY